MTERERPRTIKATTEKYYEIDRWCDQLTKYMSARNRIAPIKILLATNRMPRVKDLPGPGEAYIAETIDDYVLDRDWLSGVVRFALSCDKAWAVNTMYEFVMFVAGSRAVYDYALKIFPNLGAQDGT